MTETAAQTVTDITVAPAKRTSKAVAAEPAMNIYQLLNLISTEAGALAPASKPGVQFPFRGVDAVVSHVSPFLRKYGIIVIPTVLSSAVASNPSGNKVVTTTEILTKFTFYAPDGSSVDATVAGLANDYSDRSTAQAQSVAFRIALLQTFALPTQSPEPEQTGVEREVTREPDRVVTAGTAAAAPTGPTPKEAQGKIKTTWEGIHGKGDTGYTKLGNQMFPEGQDTWINDINKLGKLMAAVNKGEVAV